MLSHSPAPAFPGTRAAPRRETSAAPLELEVHSSCEELAPEWERLATRTLASPFLRAGWISAWWTAFGQGELKVYAVRRDRELCGVLPLVHRGAVVSSPANWHTPEFGPVSTGDEATRKLLEGMLATNPRRFDLSFVDAANPVLELLAELKGSRPLARRVLQRSPLVAIEGSWDAYEAGLSKNLRGTIKRTRRRLMERGNLSFEFTDGRERLHEMLEEGIQLEAKGWKGERGTAIASRPETRQFYAEVAEWARARGLLRLAVLRLDGRMIAFEFGLQDHQHYYLLKPAYDPALRKFGPGKLLTYETVRQSFADGLESNEFLGSDEPYKLMWADRVREREAAQLFSRSPAGRLDSLVQVRGRALARGTQAALRRAKPGRRDA